MTKYLLMIIGGNKEDKLKEIDKDLFYEYSLLCLDDIIETNTAKYQIKKIVKALTDKDDIQALHIAFSVIILVYP